MTTDNTLQQLERTADEGRLFDETTLREELRHPDQNRRELAREAKRWLLILTDLRAKADGAAHVVAWQSASDPHRMREDLKSTDPRRRKVAARVTNKLAMMEAYREVANSTGPTSLDIKLRVMAIGARVRDTLREMDIAGGRPVAALN